jgi:hypothetical protein
MNGDDPIPLTDEVLLPILKLFAPDLMHLCKVSNAARRTANKGKELIPPLI